MIGGEFSAGWGERLAVNSYQLPPVIGTTGHGTYQLMFVVAGSTSLRAIKRAVDDMKGVFKEQPKKPTPFNPRTPEAAPPEKMPDHPSLTPPKPGPVPEPSRGDSAFSTPRGRAGRTLHWLAPSAHWPDWQLATFFMQGSTKQLTLPGFLHFGSLASFRTARHMHGASGQ